MNRLLVLALCLASAGGIAVYTYYSGDGAAPGRGDGAAAGSRGQVAGTPVYTVPRPSQERAAAPAATVAARTIAPDDRVGLARALQRELKRVGCYDGEITGQWAASSRMAMKAFTERVNATLPVDAPDPVLLSLVRGHREQACRVACPTGQTATKAGRCVPDAVLAKAAADPDEAADAPSGKASAAAAAAAAMARPDGKKKAAAADRTRPAAAKSARAARHGGPVPSEGMRERRRRRASRAEAPRPPKVVRDVLKVLGFN